MSLVGVLASVACFLMLAEGRNSRPVDAVAALSISWFNGVIGCALVGFVIGVLLQSPSIVICTPILAAAAIRWFKTVAQRTQANRLASEIPAFADVLAQELGSGYSLSVAISKGIKESQLETIRFEFEPVLASAKAGRRLEEAFDSVAARFRSPNLELFATTISILAASGGAALPSLERLGDTLRAEQVAAEEAKSQASQALASAAVLAIMPFGFAALLALAEPKAARFYLYDPLGAVCLGAAIVLVVFGWFWIDRLVEGAHR